MGKKRGRVPIWLRRLDVVARQLREEGPPPGPAEERIETVLSLMAEGLLCLSERAEESNRGRRKGGITARVREDMAAFRSLDSDWIRRWRRERDRTFGR